MKKTIAGREKKECSARAWRNELRRRDEERKADKKRKKSRNL